MTDIGGKADEEDGCGDEAGAGGDEGSAAAEARGAAVAVVADEGLDEHAGDGPTEPDECGPRVRDAQQLYVRRQQRQLQRPPELHPRRYRRHRYQLPQRARLRRRRRGFGPIWVLFASDTTFNLHS